MRKYNKLIWGAVTALLMVLTVRTILRMSSALSLRGMLKLLRYSHKGWLALAVAAMLGFIVLEGESLLWILKGLGYRMGRSSGLLYSASDIFFSAITPSASGGQPASAYFMHADGIPAAVVAVTLLVNLIAYTEATMAICVLAIICWPRGLLVMDTLPRVLILAGVAALTGLLALFYLLLHRGGRLLGVGTRLIRFLEKLRLVRRGDARVQQLERIVGQYEQCAAMTRGKWRLLPGAFLLTLLQRVSQVTVTALVHLALYGSPGLLPQIWASSAFSLVGSSFLPLPGGMGAADYLLYQGFSQFLIRDNALRLGLLSRTFSFYLCMALGGLISLLGYLALRKRKEESK